MSKTKRQKKPTFFTEMQDYLDRKMAKAKTWNESLQVLQKAMNHAEAYED